MKMIKSEVLRIFRCLAILSSVRKGLYVVGIFYGHPGIFVNPSRRALTIARQEGYQALMLPAVSSIDCLFEI